jgi:hypothetical protein
MVVVKPDREVARVRKLSQNNDFVGRQVRVDIKIQLVVYAVEIALFVYAPISGDQGDKITVVIEIAEEVARRELVPGELRRQIRTILGIANRRHKTRPQYYGNCCREQPTRLRLFGQDLHP